MHVECKIVQLLWKIGWQFLEILKMLNIQPSNSTPSVNTPSQNKNMYTPTNAIAALFIKAKNENSPSGH